MNRSQVNCRVLAVVKEIHEEFVNLEDTKAAWALGEHQLVKSFGLALLFFSGG